MNNISGRTFAETLRRALVNDGARLTSQTLWPELVGFVFPSLEAVRDGLMRGLWEMWPA